VDKGKKNLQCVIRNFQSCLLNWVKFAVVCSFLIQKFVAIAAAWKYWRMCKKKLIWHLHERRLNINVVTRHLKQSKILVTRNQAGEFINSILWKWQFDKREVTHGISLQNNLKTTKNTYVSLLFLDYFPIIKRYHLCLVCFSSLYTKIIEQNRNTAVVKHPVLTQSGFHWETSTNRSANKETMNLDSCFLAAHLSLRFLTLEQLRKLQPCRRRDWLRHTRDWVTNLLERILHQDLPRYENRPWNQIYRHNQASQLFVLIDRWQAMPPHLSGS